MRGGGAEGEEGDARAAGAAKRRGERAAMRGGRRGIRKGEIGYVVEYDASLYGYSLQQRLYLLL